MAKDNIYDVIISELILRAENSSILAGPNLKLTSSLGTNQVQAGFNGVAVFTSTVTNLPLGYTVDTNSHVISYPISTPDTVGSAVVLSGASTSVILGSIASTYVVESTVTLVHDTEADIILTATLTITAVAPLYYGIKVNGSLTTTSLQETYGSATTISFTNTIFGRLWVVLPTGQGPLISVKDHNGLVLPVATNFTIATSGSFDYYILNYDTQLTGTNIKIFTLNYL